jgi:hypothetical protein
VLGLREMVTWIPHIVRWLSFRHPKLHGGFWKWAKGSGLVFPHIKNRWAPLRVNVKLLFQLHLLAL